MMRKTHRATLQAAVGVLVAAGIVVVATPQHASAALPAVCSSGAANVHNWTGGAGSFDWDAAGNWDNGVVPNGPNEVACIENSGPDVFQDTTGFEHVQVGELHLVNSGVWIQAGSGIFVNGSATSVWDENSRLWVDDAHFGGTARIDSYGSIDITGSSVIDSVNGTAGMVNPASRAGFLNIAKTATSTGSLTVEGVLQLFTDYHLDVSGVVNVGDNALISADWGTSLTINPQGQLGFYGNGGWYQGASVPGRTKAVVTNRGEIGKFVGGTTSVVDADYRQLDAGRVQVACCSTLAIAGTNIIGGAVAPHHGLATGACGLNQVTICAGSADPAVDPMSLKIFMPENQGGVAEVQELGNPAPTVDSRAVGNEVLANIDNFVGDPSDPAILTLRYSQADVMAAPLDELYVAHVDDVTGAMTKVPDCDAGAIPTGEAYCLDRSLLGRNSSNTSFRVLTTRTSRWHIRRVLAGETFDQTAPSVPTGLKASLAAPGDGSGVKLIWTGPADDGGAAPSSYKIFRDGVLAKTTSTGATSTVVKNNGPGKHTFKVQAVNIVGPSPRSTAAAVTISKTFSAPRKVVSLRGAAGGALTAGAKWTPPASSGGYAITRYKVAAFTTSGRMVASITVKGGARKAFLTLKKGRYVFKVRALNFAKKWSPWSRPSTAVSPR
jgi:hypothetical protein